jgi:hypothetical protein
MRIGTWNLQNNVRIDDKKKILLAQNCDVWLLTEVCKELLEDSGQRLAHFNAHWSSGDIRTGNKYAAVLSVQELEPVEEDIHFASAAAVINGITYCSSVLPWRKAQQCDKNWTGDNNAEMTGNALASLLTNLPKENLVWGGDWNHSFVGSESSGSDDGRKHLLNALKELGLHVPTASLANKANTGFSIDHIALPRHWIVNSVERLAVDTLSDHDAYVVDACESAKPVPKS